MTGAVPLLQARPDLHSTTVVIAACGGGSVCSHLVLVLVRSLNSGINEAHLFHRIILVGVNGDMPAFIPTRRLLRRDINSAGKRLGLFGIITLENLEFEMFGG